MKKLYDYRIDLEDKIITGIATSKEIEEILDTYPNRDELRTIMRTHVHHDNKYWLSRKKTSMQCLFCLELQKTTPDHICRVCIEEEIFVEGCVFLDICQRQYACQAKQKAAEFKETI